MATIIPTTEKSSRVLGFETLSSLISSLGIPYILDILKQEVQVEHIKPSFLLQRFLLLSTNVTLKFVKNLLLKYRIYVKFVEHSLKFHIMATFGIVG